MTKKYYHATPWENADSILKMGIQPDRMGNIFLADSPVNASKFLLIRGFNPIAVFGVELDDSQVEETFDHNEAFFRCKAWIYEGEIKVDQILEIYKIGDTDKE